ncbi:unnamed protein product [Didymodactylos carnosus]|uniref:Tetratricopeptide repeat protein n=1 Tax=Didymodactylos carnosus TaxID=1234261 RepID=A0A8S2H214_9BILA|nr:unnamed protein product [Didymodactylos carnosus]CAF3590691.1 unnamed protein product [Didymodactylos carnosus]
MIKAVVNDGILQYTLAGDEMWCVELSSSEEENARSVELTNYLKQQVGEICDLWTLGDFLMKMGEYKHAEIYYTLLEKNVKLHEHRAQIYNRLGIIRREQGEIRLAIEYFEKAVRTAPQDSEVHTVALYNSQTIKIDEKQLPKLFLNKSLKSVDFITKSLSATNISTPILCHNIGHNAYQSGEYDLANEHYQKALNIMMQSELTYLLEISVVLNNLGAVEYAKQKYTEAKEYFDMATSTLQQLNLKHPWILEYVENSATALRKIN